MKKILIFVLMFLFIASVAFAAQTTDPVKKNPSSAQLAQQEKMKSCNKEATAKALKGEERKANSENRCGQPPFEANRGCPADA